MKGTQCTARSKRSKDRCKRLVIGGGVCVMHGGKAPQVMAKRLQRIAVHEAARFTGPAPISGGEALLEELARTNGHVLELQDALDGDELAPEEEDAAWVAYRQERGHLKQVAEAVVRLNVDGRLGRVLEEQAGVIVSLLRDVLVGCGLNPNDPAVVAVVQRELRTRQGMQDETRSRVALARRVVGE